MKKPDRDPDPDLIIIWFVLVLPPAIVFWLTVAEHIWDFF